MACRDFRVPGGISPPLNSAYYLYAVYLDTLQDVYYYPLFIDDAPADNDARKMFLGGLLLQRPSLLLLGDVLYAGFGGVCDAFNYTGVLVAVNIQTRWINRWVTQAGPNSAYSDDWTKRHGGGAGGIEQAGMGIASDGQDVYFAIGDGSGSNDTNLTTPVAGKSQQNILSNSVVRVNSSENGTHLVDFFRPYGQEQYVGSSGVSVLDPLFSTGDVKRLGVAPGRDAKLYVLDLENLGGYRQGESGSDGVVQAIHLDGEVSGGVGSYPLEGGYIYAKPDNAPLAAYHWNSPFSNSSGLFTLAGKSSSATLHSKGVGTPTITSRNGEQGSAIVWMTDPERGLRAYKAVPLNGTLVELQLPSVVGAMEYGRPVFGDGRVYVVDGQGRLVALGVK
jgi:hypothetical protein